MKNVLLILSLIIVCDSYSQPPAHTFNVTSQVLSVDGVLKNIESGNPQIKIKSFTGGKYYVGIKDNSTGYFISATVKYSHLEDGVYVYSVERYDAELRNLKNVASETKLSDMANGTKGDIIFHFDSKNYWFLSTK